MKNLKEFIGLSAMAVTLMLVSTVTVFAKDSSPEQCTCDLKGFDKRTGAEVVNAASCVLELRHPWCDIYLAALEETDRHIAIVSSLGGTLRPLSQGNAQELKTVILDLFDNYVGAIPARASEYSGLYENDRGYIETALDEESGYAFKCILFFLKERKPISMETKRLKCSVGSQSRWLKFAFENEGRQYLFLFAPPR